VRVGAEAGVVEIFRAGVEGWGLLAEGLRGVRGVLLLFVEGLRFVGETSSSWSGGFAIFFLDIASIHQSLSSMGR
jgi:hypothetical protein